MEKLRNGAFSLASEELQRANSKYPLFNSAHEGESVLREELEEVHEALEIVKANHEGLWKQIRSDKSIDIESLERMGTAALELTCETIHVLAMIQKFIYSMEGWKHE
jgi:SMC interacting uncharacterized protein involved in chromosome segregation